MNIYKRYASREHDLEYFKGSQPTTGIKLRPLSGQFDVFESDPHTPNWHDVFPNSAFFAGSDAFFGPVVTMIYKNDQTSKLSAVSLTKFGTNVYQNLMLDNRSRFWPACENLEPQHRESNVRKALAVANLKNFNKLFNNGGSVPFSEKWDETNAGSLASNMQVLSERSPTELGEELLLLGLLQHQNISSLMIDVIYDNKAPEAGEKAIEENNRLVCSLGTQMEHLFDPLLEYSPQAMDYKYIPGEPIVPEVKSDTVDKVLAELVEVQTHYTMDLVGLLQDFIVPLRVSVLSSKSNLGIGEVNLVFPPTIDEIARINCILHDLLTRAAKFGYVEVFKVLGSILPYFYKAFVRHEANLTNFHSRLTQFVHHDHTYTFESKEINKGNYSTRGIEGIVSGSVLELPRLKLIIIRLYQTILVEKLKIATGGTNLAETAVLEQNYITSMEIIDSFGYKEPEEKQAKSRIFTPSGKLLTELATDWPLELQYGWMYRKVVGVYEVKNVQNSGVEVLIIFSDHCLFLEVVDAAGTSSLMLSDVLMNSLVNQKPLPNLSLLPKLRVKHWTNIGDLLIRSYSGSGTVNLSFTAYGENSFKKNDNSKLPLTQLYEVISKSEADIARIMDLLSKAKVLHKSSPFHLFKSTDDDLISYFCAQDKDDYSDEQSKSPVVMMLNMSTEEIEQVFKEHPSVYLVFNASYLNDYTVHLFGYDRNRTLTIEEIVEVDDLGNSLKDIISRSMDALFHSSYLSKILVDGGNNSLRYFIDVYAKPAPEIVQKAIVQPRIQPKVLLSDPQIALAVEPTQKQTAKNRKSILISFVSKIKRKKTHVTRLTPEERVKSNERKISGTDIPRGRKQNYQNLLNPVPHLKEASVSSTPRQTLVRASLDRIETRKISVDITPVQQPIETRMVSTNTMTSSHYTNNSLDILYDFKFPGIGNPGVGNLEAIEEQSPRREILLDKNETPIEIPSEIPSVDTTLYAPIVNGVPAHMDSATQHAPNVRSMLDPVESEAASESNHDYLIPERSPRRPVSALIVPPVNLVNAMNAPSRPEIPKYAQADVGTMKTLEEPLKNTSQMLPSHFRTTTAKSPLGHSDDATLFNLSPEAAPTATKTVKPFITDVSEKLIAVPKKRIVSSQDIAIALEKINASGVSPEIYEKYKAYESLPINDNDEEPNWVSLTRENSSNLQAEVRAMKEEANMDTLDVIDVRGTMVMQPQPSQFDSSDGTFSTLEMGLTYIQNEEADVSRFFNKEDSVQSLTSMQYVTEFERQLEEGFALSDEWEQKSLTFALDTVFADEKTLAGDAKMPAVKSPVFGLDCSPVQKAHTLMPLGTPNISSSEEEYFSSNDFATAMEFMSLNNYTEEQNSTLSASSSQKTLQSEIGKEMPGFGIRFDSVAYLSDIINGTVKI